MAAADVTTVPRLPWDPADPYPFYEKCRREGQVVWDETARAWLVLGYDAARQVLGESGWTSDPRATPNSRAVVDSVGSEMIELSILSEGAHGRLRDSLRDVFAPSVITGLTAGVEAIGAALIDHPLSNTVFDFMTDIAMPLPLAVASEWLGLDADSAELLHAESPAIVRMLGALPQPEEIDAGAAAFATVVAELLSLAADRRAHPGDDLLSFIAADPSLRLDEVIVISILVAIAGHETTAYLLGAAMVRLLESRQDGSRVIDHLDPADPMLFPELLRLDGSVHATARTATVNHLVGGIEVAAGQQVVVIIGAANRDPTVFDRPDQLDLGRRGPAPLSFGYGARYCIGAALARLETTIALRQLSARTPRLADRVTWAETAAVRGPCSLPMVFAS